MPVNEVRLEGRVTTAPQERELPSGDRISTFRISVPRGRTPMNRPKPRGTDWVDCVVAGAGCRRSVASWDVGDQVTVSGVLRRRFFRTADGAGAPTRLEVEVLRARRTAGGA